MRLTATRIDADKLATTTHELERLVAEHLDDDAAHLMVALATVAGPRWSTDNDDRDLAEVPGGIHGAP